MDDEEAIVICKEEGLWINLKYLCGIQKGVHAIAARHIGGSENSFSKA